MDATTLDPFVIRDDELVVVPITGREEEVRDDLRADPDVQDALRWLDPPSNVGERVEPPAESHRHSSAPPVRHPSEPMRHPSAPPVRHPTSPPYAAVYTPIPQAYPGAGPYPTPVPNYVPNSGAYYLATPMPTAAPAPAPPARSPLLWIFITALVTGGGVALGWWLFAGRYQWQASAEPAAQTPAQAAEPLPAQAAEPPPAQQPAPAPPVAPAPDPAAPPPAEPAAAQPVTAVVSSLTPAQSVSVQAPKSGQVTRVFLAEPGKVAKGDKLVQISFQVGGGARAKKLAARVAELEELAKNDPVYEEFLADARKAQKAAKGRTQSVVVKASVAGQARVTVAEGNDVAGGKPVAEIATGGDWIIKATSSTEIQRSWTCSIALPDGQRASCKIDKVIASATGVDITATVSSKDAPWLEDVSQKPTLILEPS